MGSFAGFQDVPGVIQRALRRAKERGHLLSEEEVSAYLEKLWDGCVATNVGFGEQLVHEIELAMARHPSVLLSYLRLAKGCDWKPCERQGLLSLSLACCETSQVRDKITGQLKVTLFNFSAADGIESEPDGSFIPASQRVVFDELLLRGEMFFSPKVHALKVQPRLNPLVAGPTGAGKTFIIESVAKKLGAVFLKVSFGDWVPIGAHEVQPTMKLIFTQLEEHPRVLLLLDELCKFRVDYAGGWSRSVATDLWQLLDRSPGAVSFSDRAMQGHDWKALMQERLWIVGAGTWQHVQKSPATMGFNRSHGTTLQERIVADGQVPDELLLRFNPQLLQLRYPLPSETAGIYDRAGITALAESMGEKLSPESHDWSRGGMRSLEDLSTTLLLKKHQLERELLRNV